MNKTYCIEQGYTYKGNDGTPITTWDALNIDNSFDQWTFDNENNSVYKEVKSFKTKEKAETYMAKHFTPSGHFTYRVR